MPQVKIIFLKKTPSNFTYTLKILWFVGWNYKQNDEVEKNEVKPSLFYLVAGGKRKGIKL